MEKIQKINRSMFYQVYELLLDFNNRNLKKDEWELLFNYKWENEEDYCGYGLVEDGKLVGFLGTIFSKRMIEGRIEKFCNLTGWIVKDKYRDKSLLLVLPILRLKDYTITDLSPSRKVVLILKKIGFNELDSKLKILFPYIRLKKNVNLKIYHVTENKDFFKKKLNKSDMIIFNDHMYYKCKHLLIYNDRNYCYIIYSIVKIINIPYCYIHYISDIGIFSQYDDNIRFEIMKRNKTLFIIIDSRILSKINVPFSFDMPLKSFKLYRSSTLRPDKIDNLYSELVILNTGTIPKLRNLLWDFSRKFLKKEKLFNSHNK